MKVKSVGISILLLIFFVIFTGLLLDGHLSEPGYVSLFVVLAACGMATYFSDRVKEVNLLNKAVIKLYQKTREGLTADNLALDVGKILAKLSKEASGSAKHRQERESMIDQLLKSARASKKEREKILEDAKLITKMMATDDDAESQELRKEIEKRGLFD